MSNPYPHAVVAALALCPALAASVAPHPARFEPLAAPPDQLIAVPLGLSHDAAFIVGYTRSPLASAARGVAWPVSPAASFAFGEPLPLAADGPPFLAPHPALDALRLALTQSSTPWEPAAPLLSGLPLFTLGAAAGDWGDAAAPLRTSGLRAGQPRTPATPAPPTALPAPGFLHVAPVAAGLDASAIAGVLRRPGDSASGEPFIVLAASRWAGTAWQALADLDDAPASRLSVATGISGDGTVIIGHALAQLGPSKSPITRAAAWVGTDPPRDLGALTPSGASAALAASGDARVIVGWSDDPAAPGGRTAVVWFDGLPGPARLADHLRDAGAYLGDWSLTHASAISHDGTVITGTGTDGSGVPGGWAALVPRRLSLDFNRDGLLTPDDLGDYLTVYFTLPEPLGPGGFALPCPASTDIPSAGTGPTQGFQAAFASPCLPPTPDDLGDFLTAYYLATPG